MHKLLYSFTTLAVLLTAAVSFASDKPTELETRLKAQEPYGSGSLEEFFFSIYDAHLWTDARQWSYDAPFALTVTYAMSISKQELIDSTLKEIFRQHEPSEPVMQTYSVLLEQAYADVKEGDRITAFHNTSGGIEFFLNGRKMLQSDNKHFAKHFFDIWLSDKASKPALRKQLLKADP